MSHTQEAPSPPRPVLCQSQPPGGRRPQDSTSQRPSWRRAGPPLPGPFPGPAARLSLPGPALTHRPRRRRMQARRCCCRCQERTLTPRPGPEDRVLQILRRHFRGLCPPHPISKGRLYGNALLCEAEAVARAQRLMGNVVRHGHKQKGTHKSPEARRSFTKPGLATDSRTPVHLKASREMT
ncbi:uncharacterized protein LOC144454421 [Phascolarctos cinereus]